MVPWLSRTQVTKSKNKRRTPARCWASQSCDGMVYARRREEAAEVTDSCWYQIIGFIAIWYKDYHLRVHFDPLPGLRAKQNVLLVSSLIKRSILVYPYFPYAHAEMYHVGDPHCPNAHTEKYFRAPRNTWRVSAQQSIEGHQKHKVRRREEVVEVTDSCF